MGFRCQALTTGIVLLIVGITFAVLVGVFWRELAEIKQLNSINGTAVPAVVTFTLFNYDWVVSATLIASPLAIFCGVIGIIGGCQQGQCITLTYLVSSVLTLFTYICLLIGSIVFFASHCQDGFKKCMKEQERQSVVLISIIAISFLIIILSLFASCLSCRARCFCCGATSKRNIKSQENMAAVSSV